MNGANSGKKNETTVIIKDARIGIFCNFIGDESQSSKSRHSLYSANNSVSSANKWNCEIVLGNRKIFHYFGTLELKDSGHFIGASL